MLSALRCLPVKSLSLFQAFYEEMSLAMHVNAPAILIRLRSSRCANLARCINHYLPMNPHSVVCGEVEYRQIYRIVKYLLDKVCKFADPGYLL